MAGASNADAVAQCDVVLLAVPYDGHDELVASLSRWPARPSISCVNPLAFDKRGAHGRIINSGEGSAAESAQELAPEATVVGAFHNVSAVGLWGRTGFLDEDVIVVGDVVEAKEVAMALAASRDRSGRHRRRQAPAGPSARAVHRRTHLDQPEVQGALRAADLRRLTLSASRARRSAVRPARRTSWC